LFEPTTKRGLEESVVRVEVRRLQPCDYVGYTDRSKFRCGAEHTERSGHAKLPSRRFEPSGRFIDQQLVGMNGAGERDGRAFAQVEFVRDLLHALVFDWHDAQPIRWL
jgi:hypothetical protein